MKEAKYGFRHTDDKQRKFSVDEPMSAVVFRTIVDPFDGKDFNFQKLYQVK